MRLSLILLFILCYQSHFSQKLLYSQFEDSNERYWLLEPADSSINRENLIVFLHGHAASNPATYGDWLIHLVEQNYIVLFPKFQNGFFIPESAEESARVDKNIDSAIIYIQRKYNFKPANIHFIGHSLGGLIAANLTNEYGKTKKHNVATLTLVQPGHKYLKMGMMETYENFDTNLRIVCVSGQNDRTAGDRFAKHIIRNSPGVSPNNKIHFSIRSYRNKGEKIGSTHEEPVCPNNSLKASNLNPVILGAEVIGKTDLADSLIFWRIADHLISGKTGDLESLRTIGKWNDGTPIGDLLIVR